MRISSMMVGSSITVKYEIFNEKEFDIFAVGSPTNEMKKCVFIEDERYVLALPENTSMIITKPDLLMSIDMSKYGVCTTENPRWLFFLLHNEMSDKVEYIGDKKPTTIGANCDISTLSCIADCNVEIGNNVVIQEYVTIKENSIIGSNSIIRSGTVIGAHGFENKKNGCDTISVKHVGGVRIGENVDISHNCIIQRGIFPWQNTHIGSGTRIDNLVLIGHASQIGERVFIVGNSMLCGHVIIGDDSWLGASVSISNRIVIGKNARVNIGSVVTKNVADGESVTGNFAIPHDTFISNLKEMSKNSCIVMADE